jgi:hypothetical protein
MRTVFSALALTILFVAGSVQALLAEVDVPPSEFRFPLISPRHENMQRLLINAMGYLQPGHGLVDPVSGYPVEGWNQEPERGLYLRSFTQLTAIGEQLELLASIAAGYADNPYVSRAQALSQIERMASSLLIDQSDPTLSAGGLLGNFLGLEATGRIGPLSEEVRKHQFVELFGDERANQIWTALIADGWIVPLPEGSYATITRKENYGDTFFPDELASIIDSDARARIMAVLDARVVQIIFGDNANLTASVAKAIGALLHPSIADDPEVAGLRNKLERFIAHQDAGYRQLYDESSGTFYFGWNATHDRYTGWNDGNGNWIIGHMDYFVNEFRGPLTFVARRFALPTNVIKNNGFKIKPYRMADGRDVYSLATWNGSAFESLGLSLFMGELDAPGWRENLQNSVDIQLDFSRRHKLPGLLSEAYSGNSVEYTGNIGIAEVAVTNLPRITDAPSLYMLGPAYAVAPDSIERFLADNREQIEGLFTNHGPWEGYNTTLDKPTEVQTAAHTLALILGGIGSAGQNMQRYLAWKGIGPPFDPTGVAVNFLGESVRWIPSNPSGNSIAASRTGNAVHISANAVRRGAVTVQFAQAGGIDLSNGALLIRYLSSQPLTAVMTLVGGPTIFQNEILLRFDPTDVEKDIRIPMPETPALEGVSELVIRFEDEHKPFAVDLALTRFEFVPAQ